jgi:hypothetical protein
MELKRQLRRAWDLGAPLWATRDARALARRARARAALPELGIQGFARAAGPVREADDPALDAPVFVLGAGWRTGSTLIQRLVVKGSGALIWGEPHHRMTLIGDIARRLAGFDDGHHRRRLREGEAVADLGDRFIALLDPQPCALQAGLRAMLIEGYGRPALQAGAAGWGVKEVRWGLAEALLLRVLFPSARFVIVHRDVAACYRSFLRAAPSRSWFARWPDHPVATAHAFGRHYGRLRAELDAAARATGALVIPYEDIEARRFDLAALASHLGCAIDRAPLETRITGAGDWGRTAGPGPLDAALLRRGFASGRTQARDRIALLERRGLRLDPPLAPRDGAPLAAVGAGAGRG